jgi:FkbM family methyltransferase
VRGIARRKLILLVRCSRKTETMALTENQFAVPAPILPPKVENFLGVFQLGRLGIRLGRAIRRFLRKIRDPIQHKIWIRQFVLPIRNTILLNRPLTVSIGEMTVFLAPRGSTAGDIWVGLHSESHEVSLILNMLEPGMVFFDIGTNAGLFAISAAKRIGGKQVFAFEPTASTCELLKQNLQLNRVADVNVEQMALGDSAGAGVLQVNVRGKDILNPLSNASHHDQHAVRQENVRIITVDTFMEEHDIPRVDVMKVDIAGAELMMFRGARRLLERVDAPAIMYEGLGSHTRGFGYHPVEILWFLESCGYTLFSLSSDTGAVAELRPDYQYDLIVIAAKPGRPTYEKLRTRMK